VKRRITYQEIAQYAKVSVSTVSRVANRNARVDPQVQERVKEAALKLGVNLQNSRNRKKKNSVLAFILSNREMLHPFHSHILVETEAACLSRRYSILFHCFRYPATKPPREIYLPPILEDPQQVSGLILAGTNFPNLLELLSRRRVPFVVLGNNVVGEWESAQYDVVWFNDVQGAHEVTQHLQALGHRDIWYVGNCRLPWYARRYEGYRRAMVEAQLQPHLSQFDSTDDAQLGYLTTKSILAESKAVSAIFAGGDRAAQGVCRALREKGLRVPDDTSVTGFNDTESARWDPPLTTVQVFPELIGRRMVELLQKRINHPELLPQCSVIPTQLIRRDSSAPIRAMSGSVTPDRYKSSLPET